MPRIYGYSPILLAIAATACAGASDPVATQTTPAQDSAAAQADGAGAAATEEDTATASMDSGATTEDAGSAHDMGSQDSGATPTPDVAEPPQITALDAPPNKGLPTFSAVKDTTGTLAKADTLKGQWTVLWFYPAASTFG